MSTQVIALQTLNSLPAPEFVAALSGIFERSPWIPERVAGLRPFGSRLDLHTAMCQAVQDAILEEQLALILAHPELAGRAAIRGELTAESTREQHGAGLDACSPEEFERLHALNAAYRDKFGFPFVLAVKGHTRSSIIAALQQRVGNTSEHERSVALREIGRIAGFRLTDLVDEPLGTHIISMAEHLARFSDSENGLTCAYLTPAHRATAAQIRDWMLAAGMSVEIDAVGNVRGTWRAAEPHSYTPLATPGTERLPHAPLAPAAEPHAHAPLAPATEPLPHAPLAPATEPLPHAPLATPAAEPSRAPRLPDSPAGRPRAPTLLTGSHYDTVVNAGKFDGRLGILLPIAVVARLRREGARLPYDLTVIGFAEEEGVRFKSTFLGSNAVAGRFDPAVLESTDVAGITVHQAMREAGLDPANIPAAACDPSQLLGFVEVHIEQGPVLLNEGHALGVVTSIAGSVRSLVSVTGLAGHAGTVPMALRKDAATAAAELVLAIEKRCAGKPGLVGTVGQLNVPGGAMNVIPGRCELSVDIRADRDEVRDAAVSDIMRESERIAVRRGVEIRWRKVLDIGCSPCAPEMQQRWADSIRRVTGSDDVRFLPSGAGHDTMVMAQLTRTGMLFVRCGNGGISHHPAENLTPADADVAARVFSDFLLTLQTKP